MKPMVNESSNHLKPLVDRYLSCNSYVLSELAQQPPMSIQTRCTPLRR